MRTSKRVSPVQFSRGLFSGIVDDQVETNIHVIAAPTSSQLIARRLIVDCAIHRDDLAQAICSILRSRNGMIVVPSPGASNELLLISRTSFNTTTVNIDNYQATVRDMGSERPLNFENEADLRVVAGILEKALVLEFQRSKDFWRNHSSARFWYGSSPTITVDGIEIIPRLSFAAMPITQSRLGVALDFGYLFRSAFTVADFFDRSQPAPEQHTRKVRFDKLRSRSSGRKGTLLYDTGRNLVSTCYFERFDFGSTCASVLNVQGFKSLFEYCRTKHPNRPIAPNDPVAYVHFKGIKHAVPVPAKWLRLRLTLSREHMPKSIRQATTMSPEQRRAAAVGQWSPAGPRAVAALGLRDEQILWRPGTNDRERLPCPALLFGQGRQVNPPSQPSTHDYKQYFRERMDKLKNGGALRFESIVQRSLYVVTPSWDDALERRFTRDLQASLTNFVGRPFQIQSVRANTPEEAIQRLQQYQRGAAVIVFDPATTDQAAYALLSYELKQWTIKRLVRRRVEERWHRMRSTSGDHRAVRDWENALDLSALDLLDLMGTTLWRIDSLPYDACVAIDVGQDRRNFALSLLICREQSLDTSFIRISKAWPKADHQHESINPEVLSESFKELSFNCRNRAFSPLRSVLILRDGHRCGDELAGIHKGLDHWIKSDLLQQDASIDIAHVQKHSLRGIRLWHPGHEQANNVLEGQAIYPGGNTAVVCCTGAASLSSNMTTDPCVLVGQPGTDIRRVARAFYAAAQLNYSTPTKPHRLAQPVREVDVRLEDCQKRNMRGIR